MGHDSIQEIIRRKEEERAAEAARQQAEKERAEAEAAPASPQDEEGRFYSIMLGEGMQENFLEVITRDGLRTCLPYSSIIWMVYDPEKGLGIDFSGFLVDIQGRGLIPRLLHALKQKRVAWIREADTGLEDHPANETYISSITITPPKDFDEEGEEETGAGEEG